MNRGTVSQSPFLSVRVWLIPIVGLALFLEALEPRQVGPAGRVVWYSVAIIIASIAITCACRIQKQFDVFEPLYLACALFLILYPLRALIAVWLDESWLEPSEPAIWKGLSASALGFACFAMGYKVSAGKFTAPRRVWLDRAWDLKRANLVSVWLLLMAIAGFAATRFLGGSFLYFISLDPDIKAPGGVKPWFFYLFWICMCAQVGALVQLGSWFATGRRTLWTVLYCLMSLLSTFFLARLFTVLFLMKSALCWHYKKSRISATELAVLSLLVVGYLGVAGLYREWISPGYDLDKAGELAELAAQQREVSFRYVVRNLDGLSSLSGVISMTPSELPYQFGSTFTPLFLKPIPRVLMPTKPLGASALVTQQVSPESFADGLVTALGAWGEWYLNFSWPGVVLGMALTGAVAAAAYEWMRATKELGRVLWYSSFLVLLFTWLRADFHAATTYSLYYFIPECLALAYIAKMRPRTPHVGAKT